MKTKICKTCKIDKSILDYYKHKGSCKLCLNQKNKNWREANKTEIQSSFKEWYKSTKIDRRDHKAKYMRERRKSDNLFNLRTNISRLIRMSILRGGYNKVSKTNEILGCSFDEFKKHIESKFESWMNWENKGLYNGNPNYGWDIDHIIPTSSAKTNEEILKLNHFSNLQPLCSHINRDIKRNN